MFKLVVLIFAIHSGTVYPLDAFRKKEPYATEAACKDFIKSKEGRKQQREVEKLLPKMEGAKVKAKFICTKIEDEKKEDKSEDDGSI